MKGIIKLSSFWAFDHNINTNRESLLDWDDCFCWFGMTLLEVFFLFFFFSFFSQMIAELLLQYSSSHPFWSLSRSLTDYSSTGRAFNNWQRTTWKILCQQERRFGFFVPFFFLLSFNLTCSHFNNARVQEDLIWRKAWPRMQRVKFWNRKTTSLQRDNG